MRVVGINVTEKSWTLFLEDQERETVFVLAHPREERENQLRLQAGKWRLREESGRWPKAIGPTSGRAEPGSPARPKPELARVLHASRWQTPATRARGLRGVTQGEARKSGATPRLALTCARGSPSRPPPPQTPSSTSGTASTSSYSTGAATSRSGCTTTAGC